MNKKFTITQSEAIQRVAEDLHASISMEEFIARVLELWPSTAKSRETSIQHSIHTEALGKTLLLEDDNTLLPIYIGMQDVRYRVPITPEEFQQGMLSVGLTFEHYAKTKLLPEEFQLENEKGDPMPNTINQTQKGAYDKQVYFLLEDWYKNQNATPTDHIIITILDWNTGRYRLTLEKQKHHRKQEKEIRIANQAIADHLFEMLENEPWEQISSRIAVSHTYSRLKHLPAIPDHWHKIIRKDPRMMLYFDNICYADDQRYAAFDVDDLSIPFPEEEPLYQRVEGEKAEQVYQFKAMLSGRKSLWRRIEIQGGQTLRDLDLMLKEAFEYGDWDHLSGFWKIIRRGQTKRFREVDVGTINPFEKGRANDIVLANLALTPEIRLKYVYDFGDWNEHRLTLEKTKVPETNAEYPRITGQNKPKYENCQGCRERGKEAIATWICYTCSNNFQEDYFLCDTCAENRKHDDHYIEKILY